MSNLIYLAILVIDVIVILDIFKQSWDTGKKLLWTIIVIIFAVIGPIVYWFGFRK